QPRPHPQGLAPQAHGSGGTRVEGPTGEAPQSPHKSLSPHRLYLALTSTLAQPLDPTSNPPSRPGSPRVAPLGSHHPHTQPDRSVPTEGDVSRREGDTHRAPPAWRTTHPPSTHPFGPTAPPSFTNGADNQVGRRRKNRGRGGRGPYLYSPTTKPTLRPAPAPPQGHGSGPAHSPHSAPLVLCPPSQVAAAAIATGMEAVGFEGCAHGRRHRLPLPSLPFHVDDPLPQPMVIGEGQGGLLGQGPHPSSAQPASPTPPSTLPALLLSPTGRQVFETPEEVRAGISDLLAIHRRAALRCPHPSSPTGPPGRMRRSPGLSLLLSPPATQPGASLPTPMETDQVLRPCHAHLDGVAPPPAFTPWRRRRSLSELRPPTGPLYSQIPTPTAPIDPADTATSPDQVRLALEPVLVEGDVQLWSYADDTYVLGPPDRVLHHFAEIVRRLGEMGLAAQPHKCLVYQTESFLSRDLEAFTGLGIEVARRGLTVTGVPIGTVSFVEQSLPDRLERMGRVLPWLPRLRQPQTAARLLSACVSTRPQYLSRTSFTSGEPEQIDRALQTALEGLPPDVLSLLPPWPSCASASPDSLFAGASRLLEAHALEAVRARHASPLHLARLTSLQGAGAGAWLTSVPYADPLRIPEALWQAASSSRLGLPIPQLALAGQCSCGQAIDDMTVPHHAVRCPRYGVATTIHDTVKYMLRDFAVEAGFAVKVEDSTLFTQLEAARARLLGQPVVGEGTRAEGPGEQRGEAGQPGGGGTMGTAPAAGSGGARDRWAEGTAGGADGPGRGGETAQAAAGEPGEAAGPGRRASRFGLGGGAGAGAAESGRRYRRGSGIGRGGPGSERGSRGWSRGSGGLGEGREGEGRGQVDGGEERGRETIGEEAPRDQTGQQPAQQQGPGGRTGRVGTASRIPDLTCRDVGQGLMVLVDVSIADPQREGNVQLRRATPTQIGVAAARRHAVRQLGGSDDGWMPRTISLPLSSSLPTSLFLFPSPVLPFSSYHPLLLPTTSSYSFILPSFPFFPPFPTKYIYLTPPAPSCHPLPPPLPSACPLPCRLFLTLPAPLAVSHRPHSLLPARALPSFTFSSPLPSSAARLFLPLADPLHSLPLLNPHPAPRISPPYAWFLPSLPLARLSPLPTSPLSLPPHCSPSARPFSVPQLAQPLPVAAPPLAPSTPLPPVHPKSHPTAPTLPGCPFPLSTPATVCGFQPPNGGAHGAFLRTGKPPRGPPTPLAPRLPALSTAALCPRVTLAHFIPPPPSPPPGFPPIITRMFPHSPVHNGLHPLLLLPVLCRPQPSVRPSAAPDRLSLPQPTSAPPVPAPCAFQHPTPTPPQSPPSPTPSIFPPPWGSPIRSASFRCPLGPPTFSPPAFQPSHYPLPGSRQLDYPLPFAPSSLFPTLPSPLGSTCPPPPPVEFCPALPTSGPPPVPTPCSPTTTSPPPPHHHYSPPTLPLSTGPQPAPPLGPIPSNRQAPSTLSSTHSAPLSPPFFHFPKLAPRTPASAREGELAANTAREGVSECVCEGAAEAAEDGAAKAAREGAMEVVGEGAAEVAEERAAEAAREGAAAAARERAAEAAQEGAAGTVTLARQRAEAMETGFAGVGATEPAAVSAGGTAAEEAIGTAPGKAAQTTAGVAAGITTGEAAGGTMAGEAAGSAVGEAAGSAAGEAVGSAAGEAAESAAGEAAGSAAGEAAGSAAGEAAGSAAGGAAGAAAGEAAADAAGEAARAAPCKVGQTLAGEAAQSTAGEVAGTATGEAAGTAAGEAAGTTADEAAGGTRAGEAAGSAAGEAEIAAAGEAAEAAACEVEQILAGEAAQTAAGEAAGTAAGEAAGTAAREAAGTAAGKAAGIAAGEAEQDYGRRGGGATGAAGKGVTGTGARESAAPAVAKEGTAGARVGEGTTVASKVEGEAVAGAAGRAIARPVGAAGAAANAGKHTAGPAETAKGASSKAAAGGVGSEDIGATGEGEVSVVPTGVGTEEGDVIAIEEDEGEDVMHIDGPLAQYLTPDEGPMEGLGETLRTEPHEGAPILTSRPPAHPPPGARLPHPHPQVPVVSRGAAKALAFLAEPCSPTPTLLHGQPPSPSPTPDPTVAGGPPGEHAAHLCPHPQGLLRAPRGAARALAFLEEPCSPTPTNTQPPPTGPLPPPPPGPPPPAETHPQGLAPQAHGSGGTRVEGPTGEATTEPTQISLPPPLARTTRLAAGGRTGAEEAEGPTSTARPPNLHSRPAPAPPQGHGSGPAHSPPFCPSRAVSPSQVAAAAIATGMEAVGLRDAPMEDATDSPSHPSHPFHVDDPLPQPMVIGEGQGGLLGQGPHPSSAQPASPTPPSTLPALLLSPTGRQVFETPEEVRAGISDLLAIHRPSSSPAAPTLPVPQDRTRTYAEVTRSVPSFIPPATQPGASLPTPMETDQVLRPCHAHLDGVAPPPVHPVAQEVTSSRDEASAPTETPPPGVAEPSLEPHPAEGQEHTTAHTSGSPPRPPSPASTPVPVRGPALSCATPPLSSLTPPMHGAGESSPPLIPGDPLGAQAAHGVPSTASSDATAPIDPADTATSPDQVVSCPTCRSSLANRRALQHHIPFCHPADAARRAQAAQDTASIIPSLSQPRATGIQFTDAQWQTLDSVDWTEYFSPERIHARPLRRVPERVRGGYLDVLSAILVRIAQDPEAAGPTFLLAAAPTLFLVPATPPDRSHTAAIATRISRFGRGEWAELVSDALGRRTPLPRRTGHRSRTATDPSTADERRIARCLRLAACNETSRACAALESAEAAPDTQGTIQRLQSKHPNAERPTPAWQSGFQGSPLVLSVDHLRRAIFTAPRGSSGGPSGWVAEHLRDTFLAFPQSLHFLLAVYQQWLRGRCAPATRSLLASSTLVALAKSNMDVRPIAIGEVLVRILSRAVCLQLRDQMARVFLASQQFGVGVTCGTEVVVRGVRRALADHPDWVVLQLDVANAFNSFHRDWMFQALQASPEFQCLIPFIGLFYGTPSDLHYRSGTGVVTMHSERGTRQGDPLSPFLYALTQRLALEPVLVEGDVQLWSYADDTYVLGPPDRVLHHFAEIVRRLGEMGLAAQPHKCLVYQTESFLSRDLEAFTGLGIEVARRGLTVTGVPIGTVSFVEQSLPDRLERMGRVLPWLPRLRQPQTAARLLSACVSTRPQYLSRTVPPSPAVISSFTRWDARLGETFQQLLASGTWACREDVREAALDQIFLPIRLGGFGIRRMARIAPSFTSGEPEQIDRALQTALEGLPPDERAVFWRRMPWRPCVPVTPLPCTLPV
ncbi:unnamed protein product, partial [Closterium sp. NIES-64]